MGEFAGAGTAVGIEIWRIEKMVPTKLPGLDGKLYQGDSYILLSTTMKGSAMVWHIHFWLGEETSQDEAGVAAYKTVELDDSLGGAPIQHRECQGHESDLFMSYFKACGLEYLPGGVDSGFNKVERDVFRTRLLCCKGKRTVRCTEKPCESASLNKGDVFILDMGLSLFLYTGADSNRYEKAKGAEMIKKIHDERGARGTVVQIKDEPDNEEFWGALGGKIEVTNPGDDDAAASKAALDDIKLFHVTDASGSVELEPVARDEKGRFVRSMLLSEDAYILDCGDSIFVWTGKKATKQEKKESMNLAVKFIADTGRPNHTPVERVVESGESSMFKSYFFQFDPVLTPAQMRAPKGNVAAAPTEKAIDFGAMHAAKAAEDRPVDDGSGKVEIWRIEDFKKVPVDPAKYGQFYGGDSYIVLYSYKDPRGKEAWIIYFWQGKGSSKDEIGASALLAKELDDEMGGAPVQVRVVQGKEPPHFRALFKGSMIVHEGGKASGFKNSTEGDSYDDDGVGLFHVKGSNAENVVGIQTSETAASLNSMDCFVLVTPANVFCWRGKGSIADEVASADKIAALLKDHTYGPAGAAAPERTIVAVAEGEEPDEFWAAIGGKGEYAEQPADEPMPSEPRLFQCTNRFGAFQVEEVAQFGQDDLLDDDVMMLDVGTAVYLWVGSGANAEEKTKAISVAANFIMSATDGRDKDISIMQVSSGNEPMMFTQFFPAWDPDMFKSRGEPGAGLLDGVPSKAAAPTPVKVSVAEALAASPPPAPAGGGAAAVSSPGGGAAASPGGADYTAGGQYQDPASTTLPYAELSSGIPAGVNPTCKEMYLSDAEFAEKFGMDKAAFAGLAAWKRKAAKEKNKLF